MPRVNLLGQAYTTKNPYVHGDTCVNYYQESVCKEDNSIQTQKQQPSIVLYPTPGYTISWGGTNSTHILQLQASIAALQAQIIIDNQNVTNASVTATTRINQLTSPSIQKLADGIAAVTEPYGATPKVSWETVESAMLLPNSDYSNVINTFDEVSGFILGPIPSLASQMANYRSTAVTIQGFTSTDSQLITDLAVLTAAMNTLHADQLSLAADQAALQAALTATPIRGLLAYNNVLYAVSSSTFYVLAPGPNNTLTTTNSFNSLSTSTGPVSMISNGNIGNQILICDGVHKYFYNIQTHAFGVVTDPSNVVATQAAYQQGYGVMANFGTNQFYITNLEDFSTMNALNFASAYTKPDPIVTVAVLKQYLIIFTQTGGEIWQNVGTTTINGVVTTFPYSNLTSSYLEQGCAAAFGVTLSVNTLYWVTRSERGQGQISRIGGGGLIVLSPEIISTRPIEALLTSFSTLSDCISWAYQQGGHEFVVFTFPTANYTIVYDVTESLWHVRSSTGTSTIGRDIASSYANLNGIHYIGDSTNQCIYFIDSTNLHTNTTASLNPLGAYRERMTQHICVDNTRMCISRLEVDIMTLAGTVTSSLPLLDLQISRDGGHTFIDYGTRPFGYDTTKNVETRVYWTLLGMSRNWVFKFSSTSTVDYVIMGVIADTDDEEQDAVGNG